MAEVQPATSGVDDIQPHVFAPDVEVGIPVRLAEPEKKPGVAAPGPLAIISDIHANMEALVAVMADIDARAIKRIICLGDVVGYGPNPLECMDLVMRRCEFSLWATTISPSSMSPRTSIPPPKMPPSGHGPSLMPTPTWPGEIHAGASSGPCPPAWPTSAFPASTVRRASR